MFVFKLRMQVFNNRSPSTRTFLLPGNAISHKSKNVNYQELALQSSEALDLAPTFVSQDF